MNQVLMPKLPTYLIRFDISLFKLNKMDIAATSSDYSEIPQATYHTL